MSTSETPTPPAARRPTLVAAGVLAALLALPAPALANYRVTQSSGVYSKLANGTALTSGMASASMVALPFSFRFFGQQYTQVSVGTSGYLTFSGTASSTTPNLGGSPAVAAWWDNLDVSNGGTLTYSVTGSTPNREVVIQWANVNVYYDEQNFTFTALNFQVHLHESGAIDLVYGPEGGIGSYSFATAGIADGQGTSQLILNCATASGGCQQNSFPTNGTIFTLVNGPDLAVTTVSTPGLVYAGTDAALSAVVSNLGGEDASNATVRFYLSNDQVLGNSDDVVLGDVTGINLAASAQQTVPFTLHVGSRNPGTYFAFAVVDPDHQINEESEDNNVTSPSRLDVSAMATDVVAVSATASAHAGQPGATLSVSLSLHNPSLVDTGPVPVGVYLSANAVVTPSDMPVGQVTLPSIAPGADGATQLDVTLPATLLPGSYTLGVVADPNQTLVESSKLNNTAADPTPVVVTTNTLAVVAPPSGRLPDTAAGSVYGYQFQASGGDGRYTWSASGALPSGLSLSAAGMLSGRPSQAQAAPQPVGLTVVDGAGHTAMGQYTLLVTDSHLPLTLVTHDLVYAGYDQPYSATLAALGGQPPYTWTLLGEGRLPSGMALASEGTLEGLARESGSFAFSVQVQDSAQATASANLILQVATPERLRAANPVLPDATLGQPYEVLLGVAGGTPPYYWDFPYCADAANCHPVTRLPAVPTDPVPAPSTTLPGGFFFSCDENVNALLTTNPRSTGLCKRDLPAGAPRWPTEAGIYSIPARIHDGAGNSVLVTYTLRVGYAQGVSITAGQLPDAVAGRDYAYTLTASSPDSRGSLTWSLACAERDAKNQPMSPCPEGLPAGLSLSADGVISGKATADAAKTSTFLVRVADTENRVDVRALAITARPPVSTGTTKKGCAAAPGDAGAPLALGPLGLLGLALVRRRRARR